MPEGINLNVYFETNFIVLCAKVKEDQIFSKKKLYILTSFYVNISMTIRQYKFYWSLLNDF